MPLYKPEQFNKKPCLFCKKLFHPYHSNNNFCSLDCIFWAKVDKKSKNDCWPWTGALYHNNYGNLRWNRVGLRAHRVSWSIAHNAKVPQGYYVCHKCDNPKCVNPSHLFIATPLGNTLDMLNKKRHCHGARRYNAKLNSSKVKKIKTRLLFGHKLAHIAKDFGVHRQTIANIRDKKVWKHVKL